MNISSIKQQPGESITNYFTRFLSATNSRELPQMFLVNLLCDGLEPAIKRVVMPQELKTLESVRLAALRAERTLLESASTPAPIMAMHTSIDNLTQKLDMLTDFLIQRESNAQPQQQPQPPNTWSRKKHQRQQHQQQNGTELQSTTSKNFSGAISHKEKSHDCKICTKKGHFEQNCPLIPLVKPYAQHLLNLQ
jgi:hypothetical protein